MDDQSTTLDDPLAMLDTLLATVNNLSTDPSHTTERNTMLILTPLKDVDHMTYKLTDTVNLNTDSPPHLILPMVASPKEVENLDEAATVLSQKIAVSTMKDGPVFSIPEEFVFQKAGLI